MICDDVCCERFAYIIMTVSNVGHCSCKCDIFMQNALGLKNLKSKQNCIPFFTNHSPIKFYN